MAFNNTVNTGNSAENLGYVIGTNRYDLSVGSTKGTTKCPICGHQAEVDTETVLTCMPPKYNCHCKHCGNNFYIYCHDLTTEEIGETILPPKKSSVSLTCEEVILKVSSLSITIKDFSIFDTITINGIVYERK